MLSMLYRCIALFLCAAIVSGSQAPASAELTGHYLDKLEMTVSLPSDAYVTGTNVSKDFKPLEIFGMTASELEIKYKNANILCNAVWFGDESDMTEIIISMKSDESSKSLYNLNKADEYSIDRIERIYYGYQSDYGGFSDVSRFESEQALYIKVKGTINAETIMENHLQYMTVVNGKRYEISLIEHYGLFDENEQPMPAGVSEKNERMMDDIIHSLRFDRIKREFLEKNKSLVIVISIGIALCLFFLVSSLCDKRKKKKAKNK